MGEQLSRIFDEAAGINLNAKMRLVMLVGMTTGQAQEAADTAELVTKAKEALVRIKNEIQ